MKTDTKSKQAIIDHAKKNLGLSEKEITVEETPIPGLPGRFDVFYLEEKGSYGNVFRRYVVSDGDLFSSDEEDGLERLLKKENYLQKKHLSSDELIILFRLLKANMDDTEVIGSSDLAKGGVYEKYQGKVIPPSAEESKDSVKIVFWAKHLRHRFPEKWTFTILPDYKVEYHHEELPKQ